MQKESPRSKWARPKAYLHLTKRLSPKEIEKFLKRCENPSYVAKHAFMPLLYKELSQRRFKKYKVDSEKELERDEFVRSHNYLGELSKKDRPIHYPTHTDALIYSLYAKERLSPKYEALLKQNKELEKAVIAYRNIPVDDSEGAKSKCNIHFAKEVFEKIKDYQDCYVVCVDVKGFFPSINHTLLKQKLAKLLGESELPSDYYNIFKSLTKFSYIKLDSLRMYQSQNGRKHGFDEKKLSDIRKEHGIFSFFSSPKEFRNAVKNGEFRIHKNQRLNKDKKLVGIPMGTAISPLLANLYMYDFDKWAIEEYASGGNGFYRRYSDDIVFVVKENKVAEILEKIDEKFEELSLKVSKDKTEVFRFKNFETRRKTRLQSYAIENGKEIFNVPFKYLGFEFYGYQTLIKSSGVSNFYREMIDSVKTKRKRIISIRKKTLTHDIPLFKRKIKRLYAASGQKSKKYPAQKARLTLDPITREYRFENKQIHKEYRGNYLSYVNRASKIMGGEDEIKIKRQLRKSGKVLKQAWKKHIED